MTWKVPRRRSWLSCVVLLVPVLARPALASLECAPIPGAASILRPGVIVLLGEIHGTEQAPEALAALACDALERGLDVSVALEIPGEEQDAIERFLTSDAGPEDVRALIDGSFWQRDFQDGRSSRAMLVLLETIGRYRAETTRAHVEAIDDPRAPGGRDEHMASRVIETLSGPDEGVALVLVGNLHNRLVVGTRWDPQYTPMGYRLAELVDDDVQLVSLRITHSGGSAWVCTGSEPSDCGARELEGEDLPMGVELFDDPSDEAFTGRLHVGRITASSPAKAR